MYAPSVMMHSRKNCAAVGSLGRFQKTIAPITNRASLRKNHSSVGNISSSGSVPRTHQPSMVTG